jgi:hypothetical protein
MRKILVIGAGGIGSYLLSFLNRIGVYHITCYDDDKVEEKNLLYQNFTLDDLSDEKVRCFSSLNFNGEYTAMPFKVLTQKQLLGYDLVICCADNLSVRKLLYTQGHGEDAPVKWLDLRAQGRNAALISYKVGENFQDTLLAGPEGSFSCQGGDWDGTGEEVNCMHMMIAGYAAQWIQRWFLDRENVVDKVVMNI